MLNRKFHDNYKVSAHIASGSFGNVFRVHNISTDAILAAKRIPKTIIKNNITHDNTFRIRREINIWNVLSEIPNVNQLHDVCEDDNNFYLIQDYLAGGCIHEQGDMDISLLKSFIYELLTFLKRCHQKDIVYGDVKPHNIMFKYENCIGLKIIDFGCSRNLNHNGFSYGFCGTPIYCAPEVWNKNITIMADSWSVGILIYYLLSKRYPFWNTDETQYISDLTLHAVKKDIFERNIVDLDLIPKNAADLIRKLLEKDPEYRITCEDALNHSWFHT